MLILRCARRALITGLNQKNELNKNLIEVGKFSSIKTQTQSVFTNVFHNRKDKDKDTHYTSEETKADENVNQLSHMVKAQVFEKFESEGLKSVFNDEILTAVSVSSSNEDLHKSVALIDSILSDDLRRLDEFNSTITRAFFRRCFEENVPDPAKKLWTSPSLANTRITNNTRICQVYYDLLYNCAMYEEVLKEFRERYDVFKHSQNCLLIVSFCCYKIGTREALNTCLNTIVPLISLEYRGKSKIEMAAALLAYNLGEFAVAHNIVRRQAGARPPRRYPVFYKNLEILILASAGRPAEALRLTRTQFVPKSHLSSNVKSTMVNQTAEELVKSVMKTKDQEMLQELKSLLEFFENTDQVEVMSKSLEEYLLSPIDLSNRSNKDDF